MEISESSLARNILSKMSALSCLYTVQIIPRTDVDSLEVVYFDHLEDDSGLFGFLRRLFDLYLVFINNIIKL